MNKIDLILVMVEKSGFIKKDVEKVLNVFVDVVIEVFFKGEKV